MRFSLSILALGLATSFALGACSSKPMASNSNPPEGRVLSDGDKPGSVSKIAEHAVEPIASASKTECTTKGDARVLELRTKGKGCELAYTKNGQEGIVASAASGNTYCEQTMNKIRERLKGSGFDCK